MTYGIVVKLGHGSTAALRHPVHHHRRLLQQPHPGRAPGLGPIIRRRLHRLDLRRIIAAVIEDQNIRNTGDLDKVILLAFFIGLLISMFVGLILDIILKPQGRGSRTDTVGSCTRSGRSSASWHPSAVPREILHYAEARLTGFRLRVGVEDRHAGVRAAGFASRSRTAAGCS